ncbi:MAG: hypothetical protein AAF194_03845, partial [Pseudomonadota bacterium]
RFRNVRIGKTMAAAKAEAQALAVRDLATGEATRRLLVYLMPVAAGGSEAFGAQRNLEQMSHRWTPIRTFFPS